MTGAPASDAAVRLAEPREPLQHGLRAVGGARVDDDPLELLGDLRDDGADVRVDAAGVVVDSRADRVAWPVHYRTSGTRPGRRATGGAPGAATSAKKYDQP